MKDDDENEENTFGVTRYACMPSLVALQQMRNRLHLAFLGRKLMKWTMLATGRELRRIAGELDGVYKGFNDDMREAFILLARSRYFYPELNKMVIENVPKQAGVVVIPTTKAVSAVKLMHYKIYETEAKPYVHLGIEKGGQTILETKKAWLELLKRLILMLQLRTSFETVEGSNKAATKKMNVLGKIVIPKTNVTMAYINNELEELAREEFFRLKKVLDIKRKLKKGKEVKKPVEEKPKKKRKPIIPPPEEIEEGKCILCGAIIQEEPITEEEKALQDEKLERLKAQINEIVNITRGLNEEGILHTNVNDFLKTAEDLKEKIGTSEYSFDFEQISVDLNIDELCLDCRVKYLEEHKKKEVEEPSTSTTEEPLLPEESKDVPSPDLSHATGVTIKEPSKETLRSGKTPQPSEVYSQPDIELGTFETEEKEIVKIKRVRNEDGTYSEQKKVIKIKREVKAPVRGKSTASNANNSRVSEQQSEASRKSPYSGSRTIGLVELKTGKKAVMRKFYQRKVKSVPITPACLITEPMQRFSVSSATLLQLDSDTNYSSSSDEFLIISYSKSDLKIGKAKGNQHDSTVAIAAVTTSEEELLLKILDTSDIYSIGLRSQSILKLNKLSKLIVKEVYKQPETPSPGLSTTTSWQTKEGLESEHILESDLKLEYIKKHINDLIILGKTFIGTGVEYIDVTEFLQICENAKEKIEETFKTNSESQSPYKEDYNTRLDNFKGHLRDVIELAKDLKEDTIVDPNVENFIHACEQVDEKINVDRTKSMKSTDKTRLQKLDSHIDDVVRITREYKKQGILSPSVEEFMNSCKTIKLKIKEYSAQESKVDKINHLKEHVSDLEVLTDEVKKKGLESKSMEDFSKSCKKFKDKLESYAKSDRKDIALSTLLEQIDETIGISMEAKDIGIVGDSIEDLVKSSEKLKKRFMPVEDTKSRILKSLKANIDDVMSIIDRYKEESLVSDSVEDFLRTCEMARHRIDEYEVFPPNTEVKPSEPPCYGNCGVSCNTPYHTEVIMPSEDMEICKSCNKMFQKENSSLTPCGSCTDEMKEVKVPSDFSVCETCSNTAEPILEVVESPSKISDDDSDDIVYCDICRKVVRTKHDHEPPTVDSKTGYFEKKKRKVVKITRSQNPDGTIREETQTISIRKVRRDNTQTSLEDDDDDDDDGDTSESSDDGTRVALCTLRDHNQCGFFANRLIKSDIELKTPLMISGLRSCISMGTMASNANEPLELHINSSNNFELESV
ncbi:unnamed protein product [Leptosia nina]|uniref:Uncharacterized protein n=1 Tax=Leptosia nina TaxID=320188 RepID=A0AAV1JJX9_9NEOP